MLWLLKAEPTAPGWKSLLKDASEDKIDWRLLDRDAFVIVRADEPPAVYEGFSLSEPADGLYVDQQGNHLCIVDKEEVAGTDELIAALGEPAQKLLAKTGDPLAVLQRLGKAY